jgi:predicted MPP superfamily phosphohydrolase
MFLSSWNPFHQPSDIFEPSTFLALLIRAPIKLVLYHTYTLLTSLRSTPKASHPPIRVVCLSDTHTLVPQNVPDGDILIHAGDMTQKGSVAEIQAQVDWLAALPHKEIVVISGNHDTYLDPRTRPSLSEEERSGSVEWGRIHYLQHRRLSLNIETSRRNGSSDGGETAPLLADAQDKRRIRIYGAPQIPACGPASVHAFQYERGKDAWSETVPRDTDILVTHTPPKYHLDLSLPQGLGCEHLLKEVERVKPVLGSGQDGRVVGQGARCVYTGHGGAVKVDTRIAQSTALVECGESGVSRRPGTALGPRVGREEHKHNHGERRPNVREHRATGQHNPGRRHIACIVTAAAR